VALLRVVLFKYAVIVLDEPTTALDAECQTYLWLWMRRLRAERSKPGSYRPTVLLVTHDQHELKDIVDEHIQLAGPQVTAEQVQTLVGTLAQEKRAPNPAERQILEQWQRMKPAPKSVVSV
jgi:ABC-type Mn2+/Zn2+ transport system ATPase subunit